MKLATHPWRRPTYCIWLIALVFLFSVLAPHAAAQTTLLGDTNIESGVDSNSNGRAQAYKFTAGTTGTVTSLSWYLDSTNTATTAYIGLYADSSGNPGSLLTSASKTGLTAGAWNTVSVSGASVTSGTSYWIAILGTAGTRMYYRDGTSSCSGLSQLSSSGTLTSLPNPWVVGNNVTSNHCPLSAYGSGSASGTKLLSASPTSLAFGNVIVGQNSRLSTVVTNTGTATVTLGTATITGSGYTIYSGPSNGTQIAPSATATYTVQFAPAATGASNGTLTIPSDATNSPATVSLSGTGITKTLSASPTSLAFGNVTVGQNSPLSTVVTNTGTATVTLGTATISGTGYTIYSGPSNGTQIAAGATATYTVQFAPSSAGASNGTLTIPSDATNSPATVSLSGTGITKALSASPTSLAFGNVTVGQNSQLSTVVTNTGTATVTLGTATIAGTGYTIYSGPSNGTQIAPSRTATYTVQFAPTATGASNGTLTIPSDATNSPATVSLSGTGVTSSTSYSVFDTNPTPGTPDGGADSSVELGMKFQSAQAGTVNGVRFYKSSANTGTHTGSLWTSTGTQLATVTFSGETASGWQQMNFSSGVSISANTVYVISYHCPAGHYAADQTPAAGSFNTAHTNTAGNLTGLADGTSGSDGVYTYGSSPVFPSSGYNKSNYYVDLIFTQTSTKSLSASPTTLAFGNVVVNTSSQLTTTITNNGTQNVTISSASISGTGYTISSQPSLPLTLVPNGTTQYTVQFAPTATGAVNGTLTINSDASNSPAAVSLSGTGVTSAKTLSASPSSLAFGNVTVGQNSNLATTITNTGNQNVTISAASISGTGFSIYSQPSLPLTLTPGSTTSYTVQFAPGSATGFSGTLTVTSDATNSPTTVSLTGTGVTGGGSGAPVIFFTDLTSGPNSGGESVSGYAGAYVTIYGNNFGGSQGSSTITWNGQNCLRVVSWGTSYLWYQKIVVQLGSSCSAGTGNFSVTVNGVSSSAETENTNGGTQTPSQFSVRTNGAIHCVSTSGNDNNAGTFSGGCWQTIVKGRQISAGDITYVENGVSQTGTDGFASLTLNGTGTAANPLALVVYPGATATIGATSGNDGIRFCSGYGACSNGGSYWTIAGFTVRGANSAISISGGTANQRFVANDASCPNGAGETACVTANYSGYTYLYGNVVHDSGTTNATKTYHLVYLSSNVNDNWLGWNSVHDGGACRGIQFYSTDGSDQYDLHVHDNLVYNVRCDGVNFSTVDPDTATVEAYNNVEYKVGMGPDPSDGSSNYTCFNISSISTHTKSVQIYNNTCYNAGFASSDSSAPGSISPHSPVPTQLKNNIFYQNNSEPYMATGSDGCSGIASGSTNNNWYGNGAAPSCSNLSGNVNLNPQFVSITTPDFHLQSGSPMKGAGTHTGASAFDYDGNARANPPSIGAYE